MLYKTYGITGFIEYTAEIAVGKAHLSLHFSGGSINNYGTYPAQYRSTNTIEQAIIENSPLFRSGRITLLRTDVVDDPEPVKVVQPKAAETVGVNAQVVAEPNTAIAEDKEVKKFASLADAKEYLQQQGIAADGIKFKSEAIEIAKANGIAIEFAR